MVDSILELASELLDPRPAAVGLAVPGLVREADGVVREATNLGLRDVPMHELAAKRLQTTVAVLHDVRAATPPVQLVPAALGAAAGRYGAAIAAWRAAGLNEHSLRRWGA